MCCASCFLFLFKGRTTNRTEIPESQTTRTQARTIMLQTHNIYTHNSYASHKSHELHTASHTRVYVYMIDHGIGYSGRRRRCRQDGICVVCRQRCQLIPAKLSACVCVVVCIVSSMMCNWVFMLTSVSSTDRTQMHAARRRKPSLS